MSGPRLYLHGDSLIDLQLGHQPVNRPEGRGQSLYSRAQRLSKKHTYRTTARHFGERGVGEMYSIVARLYSFDHRQCVTLLWSQTGERGGHYALFRSSPTESRVEEGMGGVVLM